MGHLRLILGSCALAVAISGLASAGEDKPDVLQSSAAARSGAGRAGGPEMTSPPHASTATGQQPDHLSADDTRHTKHPRNRAVVGPQPSKPKAQAKK
jgi:hypothetical protein